MIIPFDTDSIRVAVNWGKYRNDDGTPQFPDKPDIEYEFDPELALAYLLLQTVIFTNNFWYETTWSAEAQKRINIEVICNDVFGWAMADAECLDYDEIEDLYDHYEKDKEWGPAIWCIKKRKLMPQKPVYDRIQAAGIWDLNQLQQSLGLELNGYALIKGEQNAETN